MMDVNTRTSSVTGVTNLAAASATILPTLPLPNYLSENDKKHDIKHVPVKKTVNQPSTQKYDNNKKTTDTYCDPIATTKAKTKR